MFSILVHRKALKEIDEFPTEDKQRILGWHGSDSLSFHVKVVTALQRIVLLSFGKSGIGLAARFRCLNR